MKMIGTLAVVALLAGCGGSTSVVAQGDGDGSGDGATTPASTDRPMGEWRTTSIDEESPSKSPLVTPKEFDLRFFDDGRVLAQARCNSISGAYRISDGRFRMDEAAQTEMGCPGADRHAEDQWLASFLTSGPVYDFTGTRISLDSDTIRVELAPRREVEPDKALGGTRWELTHLTDGPAPGAPADPNSAVSASMAPPKTTLQFGVGLSRSATAGPDTPTGSPPSGTLKGSSGCTDFFTRAELVQSDEGPGGVSEKLRFGPLTVDDSRCGSGRPAGLEQVLAVLQGDVIAKVHLATLTLTHSSGKGMQLSATQDASAG